MENTPYLYDTLIRVLSQHANWLDFRHLKTLAWMLVGLINSHSISLGAWSPFVVSRAQYSQSTVRRFRRWLDNDKIDVHTLYGPLMQQAMVGWFGKRLYVALDTSMLWDTYCIVRLSVIYRGRAVPLVWSVLEHGSAAVAYEVYKELLDKAAKRLPRTCKVVFLADRGFADTKLMGISNDSAGTFTFASSRIFGCTVRTAISFRWVVSASPLAMRGFGIMCG